MSQLPYQQYYKQHGVRHLQSLLAPRPTSLTELPRDALIHYLTHTGVADIDPTQLYFKDHHKRIMLDFADVLVGDKGAYRPKPLKIKNLVRDWLFEHKQFKYQPEHYKTIQDPLTLLMINYNYLDRLYRYPEMPMTAYNKWWNAQNTLWTQVERIAEVSARNQFVFIDIPQDLPGYTLLQIFSLKTSVTMLKVFDTVDKLALLDLWKWLNPETRRNSMIANVDPKHYGKVNLVFTNADNNSIVVNLGYLNSWIEEQPNVTDFASVIQLKPVQLQKVFLKFMMAVHSIEELDADPLEAPTVDEADQQEADALKSDEEEFLSDHAGDDESTMSNLVKTDKPTPTEAVGLFKEADKSDIDLSHKFKDIEEDLKVLDVLSNKKLLDKGVKVDQKGEELVMEEPSVDERTVEEIRQAVFTPPSIEESLRQIAAEHADIGALTASEYKSLIKDIERFPTLKDPYGSSQTIQQAAVVTREDLALSKEKITIAPIKTVFDPGMLESSLLSFDSDYNNKVLKKDILSMTAAVQRAGVVIKSHEVEIDHSALGTYENHTVELKPIKGAPSVLRFRLPKVDENGVFVANSNKYLMRKQRVDLPIRKINPTEVALTSYYGKTFVERGAKKANNSLEWILKQINLSLFDDQAYINKVAPANVFDNNVNAPYIYSGLSNHYKSLVAGSYLLSFDYHTRGELLGGNEALLAVVEQSQRLLVGLTQKKQPIVIDSYNQFFTYDQNVFTPIGNVFTVLGLQEKAAPIDFTEVRVFNKTVPVGVFISYFIGLSGLIKLLNVDHQVVETKPRVLKPDEFTLAFRDVTYVFSTRDTVASMVLGGFTAYAKQLKQYAFKEFNHKDVYFNLLRDKGLTSIYMREIELTNQLFVDPITEGILIDMKEPTTFIGLLIRATEMLQAYHHPDPQDMDMMRIRGYERLSGVVYKELIGSIRQFNNRNIGGRSKLEMSPYKVWQTISKDASIKLVEDINPIQNLKESEVVTYVGEGGRSKETMNKPTRAYHPKDIGVVSEATVDSSDVGINAYLTANPNFANLRGLVKKDKTLNMTSMLSTTANLAVGSTNDD